MNLRNWTAAHTKGLILGVISPVVFIPKVILLLCWIKNFKFKQMLNMFNIKHVDGNGFIVPYQPWVKDAYWNLFGKYMNNTKVDKERFTKKI